MTQATQAPHCTLRLFLLELETAEENLAILAGMTYLVRCPTREKGCACAGRLVWRGTAQVSAQLQGFSDLCELPMRLTYQKNFLFLLCLSVLVRLRDLIASRLVCDRWCDLQRVNNLQTSSPQFHPE
jgi:hypothetical protein